MVCLRVFLTQAVSRRIGCLDMKEKGKTENKFENMLEKMEIKQEKNAEMLGELENKLDKFMTLQVNLGSDET
jgi:hypothetical protein